jgi:CRP-like cAMP-binding protein
MKLIHERENYLVELKKRGRVRSFRSGEEIFCEGDDAEYLPIVLSGKVKMVRYPEVGKEIIIGMFVESQIFAVPPVFDGGPYPATAVAMEDAMLLLVHRVDFLEMIRENPDFSMDVISWMCGMLREKTAVIKNLATSSPEHRIVNVLLKVVSQQSPDGQPTKIALRRQDIAEMSGLTTETTIRAVRKLADKDLIRIIRGKIIVDDPQELENFIKN